jgi:hypothetical protein
MCSLQGQAVAFRNSAIRRLLGRQLDDTLMVTWMGSREWSPACMPASASTCHRASSLGELARRDAKLAAERVERLAAEEPQDDLGLAAAGPAAAVGGMVGSLAFAGSARALRSLRRRRRLVSQLPHGVVDCALESRMGVSGNCAVHQR